MNRAERAAVAKLVADARAVLEMVRYVRFTDGRDVAARIVLDEIEKAGLS